MAVDPALGPTYLYNVYLEEAYMRIWVRAEDVTSVAFLIQK